MFAVFTVDSCRLAREAMSLVIFYDSAGILWTLLEPHCLLVVVMGEIECALGCKAGSCLCYQAATLMYCTVLYCVEITLQGPVLPALGAHGHSATTCLVAAAIQCFQLTLFCFLPRVWVSVSVSRVIWYVGFYAVDFWLRLHSDSQHRSGWAFVALFPGV